MENCLNLGLRVRIIKSGEVGPQGKSGGPPGEITWAPRGNHVGPQGKSRGPPPFEHEVCKETFAVYETLPVVDGYLFSGNSVRSGAFFSFKDGKDFSCKEMKFIENDEKCCDVIFKNDNDFVKFFLSENEVKITSNKDFEIENVIGRESKFVPTLINNDNKKITFKYLEKEYGIELLNGEFLNDKKIISESSEITLSFFHKNDIV